MSYSMGICVREHALQLITIAEICAERIIFLQFSFQRWLMFMRTSDNLQFKEDAALVILVLSTCCGVDEMLNNKWSMTEAVPSSGGQSE